MIIIILTWSEEKKIVWNPLQGLSLQKITFIDIWQQRKNFINHDFVLADTQKTDQPAIIVVAGLVGILLGILGCLAVMLIWKRRVKKTQIR